MYHYVRNNSKEFPNFNNLSIDDFRRQIELFDKKYGFITKEQFCEGLKTGVPPDGVLLTFDDGFKDHYENVYPILKEKNIFAFFYVPTGHYKTNEKKLLGVHRVHYLKGKYDPKVLLTEAMRDIDSAMLDNKRIKEFDKEIYLGQKISSSEYKFKRLFNYFLKHEYRNKILDELMKKYFAEDELYDKLYLTNKEMKEMHMDNFVIGSHTENHMVLSRLSYNDQEKEIVDSFEYLEQTLGSLAIKSFCYPYGGINTFNNDTISILKKNKVHHAFMFSDSAYEQRYYLDRYKLKRIDCNRF